MVEHRILRCDLNKFLGKMKKKMLAAGLAASLLVSTTAFAALPEIITLSELQPGMQGTGYTVIDGSGEIKPFDVQVVGVLGDSSKLSAKRILVNLSGDLINQVGGAISGMSGSPIYFDGKLAGALSAAYADMYPTERIMLTPIEDMLKIWDYKDEKNKTRMPQLDLKKMKAEREEFAKQQAELEKKKAEKAGTAEAQAGESVAENGETAAADTNIDTADTDSTNEVQTAENSTEVADENSGNGDYAKKTEIANEESNAGSIDIPDGVVAQGAEEKGAFFTSGFGYGAMQKLQAGLNKLGANIDSRAVWDPGASMMAAKKDVQLYPGSSVGVALAIGDFTIGSLGTVTAVDDNRILAFGHSFTHRGNVNYFMTEAPVLSTIHGLTNGMKLGSVNGIIGRINQDRQDGIGGIIGEMPQTMSVIVKVHDLDSGKDVTYNTMLAYDEELISLLAPLTVYSSIANTLDRQDSSTADIKFALRSNYGPNGVLERRNMFYDGENVAQASIEELSSLLGVIVGNREKEPDMLDLKVNVTVEKGRKTALLVSAVPSKKEALPGETVNFETTIKPYRGENIKVNVPYTIPETQHPGEMPLDVHGGGMVNVTKILLEQQAAAEAGQNMDEEPPVETQLESMLSANCNNDIIIESTVVIPKDDAELEASIKRAKEMSDKLAKRQQTQPQSKSKAKPPANKATTGYIIENVIHTSIKVLEEK